jgi:hypothetical protein
MGITNDQFFDRQISSVMLSVKNFSTNCVSYTNRIIIPSVKLFNGVVEFSPLIIMKFSSGFSQFLVTKCVIIYGAYTDDQCYS